MVDCPSCKSDVEPNGGRCPNCGHDIDDTESATRVNLTVYEGALLFGSIALFSCGYLFGGILAISVLTCVVAIRRYLNWSPS